MRGRNSLRYGWAVGFLGVGYMVFRLFSPLRGVLQYLKPEYFALLILYSVLDSAGMRVRAGVVVNLSFAAVLAADLIGGEVPALAVGIGPLLLIPVRHRPRTTSVFNTGVHMLSTAAASACTALLGRWPVDPLGHVDRTAVVVFVAAYVLVGSLIVGVYSSMSSSRSQAKDHLMNLGLHVVHMVIATIMGGFIAASYTTWGLEAFFLACAMISAMAVLISQSTRVAINRDGLFGLYKAASSINEALTLNEVFVRAKDFAFSLLAVDFAWLALESGEGGQTISVENVWAGEGVDIPSASAHASAFLEAERSEQEEGFRVFSDTHKVGRGYLGTIMVMSLRLGKERLGEFGLATLSPDVYVTRDVAQIFAVLSSHLTLAVDNAVKYEKATVLAYTDPLTGVYNYRHFQHLLEEHVNRAEKSGTPVSLIYMDLDYFREINNTYGHQVGDEALKAIAHLVKESCRDDDLVSRPGGDEFTVILPGVGKEQARTIAGRIRDNLGSAELDVGLEKPLSGAVGASLGVATYPDDGRDPGDLVRNADADMYAGKSEGGRENR